MKGYEASSATIEDMTKLVAYRPYDIGNGVMSALFNGLPVHINDDIPRGEMRPVATYNTSSHTHTAYPPHISGTYDIASHTHSISPSWENHTTPPKETKMTTLERVARERRERREEERIEEMYAEYDDFEFASLEDLSVCHFAWTPEGNGAKCYEYAAIKTGDRWYVTGRESPNGLDDEDFVAWLIGKNVPVGDLIWMGDS